uniref:Uncharacterized protein n=1 Tax=Peronospora matthiolae TaxID=2874970 RepID=A0AAV1U7E1_9STRA
MEVEVKKKDGSRKEVRREAGEAVAKARAEVGEGGAKLG